MTRPLVIEFSGLPNSGKTTLLRNLRRICECNNISTIVMQESAELYPKIMPKGTIEQNLWITLETLQKCLEVSYLTGARFIFVDRGFYNQLFWATRYKEKDEEYSKYITGFMEKVAEMYRVKPDYLYIVDVDIDESIRRRMNSGEPITFSKKDFLTSYKSEFKKFAEKIDSKFYIDSTNLAEDEVAEIVFKKIVTL